MTREPSIKEALEDLQHFSDTQLECNPKMQKVVATVIAALATFQPDGERREAIARIIDPRAFADFGEVYAFNMRERRYFALAKADELLASGLVQDEAGIRRDEREKCAFWHDDQANIEMNSLHCGDNASTICEARRRADWHTKAAAAIRSARDGGAES